MKKQILLCIMAVFSLSTIASDSTHYSLTAMAEYGYNATYGHFGGADLKAYLPINEHFEIEPGIQLLSSNCYSGALSTRALFPLPVGSLYLENRLLYKAIIRDGMYDFNASIGIGYRMDYVNVTFGIFGRFMDEYHRDIHSNSEILAEPYNLLYRVEVFVRPQDSNWNISACISNSDDFQMERMWTPLFMLGGKYKPTEHLSVLLQTECKPTGMFHLCASFYGINARAGITYEF